MPSRFRLYIAVSLDGFIATPDGGVAWLDDYPSSEFGFDEFLASIGTVVMGRATYEQALGFGEWPFAGKRVVVLSSRPLRDVPDGVERRDGDPRDFAESLRAAGDVWVMGGAKTARGFREAGLIDEIELYVIPLLLGDGVPLWAQSGRTRPLCFVSAEAAPRGVVKLVYRVI